MSVEQNERHVVVQKRRYTACVFCGEKMEPQSHKAAQKCPAREEKEGHAGEVRTMTLLHDVAGKMKRDLTAAKRKAPRVKSKK